MANVILQNGYCLLSCAAENGLTDVVKLLLEKKVQVNVKNGVSCTHELEATPLVILHVAHVGGAVVVHGH